MPVAKERVYVTHRNERAAARYQRAARLERGQCLAAVRAAQKPPLLNLVVHPHCSADDFALR